MRETKDENKMSEEIKTVLDQRLRNRKHYLANTEKLKAQNKEYYHEHRDVILAKQRERRKTPEGKAAKRRWRENSKSKSPLGDKKAYLRKRYDSTSEEIERIKVEQGNCCALCGEEFLVKNQAVVDHDHETGDIRGIIHASCNAMIGMAHDKPEILILGSEYLMRTKNGRGN
jgi:hypothetical protein